MAVEGETKVNVGHIIRVVIPRQYGIPIQIASLIELVANSLDAIPSVIVINSDAERGILEVTDDGAGMDRGKFAEYHDITPAKTIGTGIGFAGQGAKLALNFCEKVVTETYSPTYRGGTVWHLVGDRAPYQPIKREDLSLSHQGTKVLLYLTSDSKAFYGEGLIEEILAEHYAPLLDDKLLRVYKGEAPILVDEKRSSLKIYKPIYPRGCLLYTSPSPRD